MTFKLNSRVVLGLAALAAGVLISDWALAQAAAPAAAPAAPPAPTFNKGDNAWMLTSSVLVLLMTIPGLALFYGGMVRPKNMLSVLMHVFYTVCIVTVIWVIRLQPRLHRGFSVRRRLFQGIPHGGYAGFAGGNIFEWRHDP